MPRGARGRSRGRGFSRAVHRIMRNELRVHERGNKYMPSSIPRQIVQCPWNDFIWSTTISAEHVVNVGDIAKNCFLTLGLFSDAVEKEVVDKITMSIRVIKVEAWEMSGNPIMIIARNFIENASNKEEITAVENLAGRMSFARVGYQWPVSQQNVVFHSDDDKATTIFSVHFAQEQKKVGEAEVRVHILWKGTIRSFPQFQVSDNNLNSSFMEMKL